MRAEELCEKIRKIEEFTLDRAVLEYIEALVVEKEEDTKVVVDALLQSYWQLPKLERQKEWISCVIEQMEKRKDGIAFAKSVVEGVKRIWMHVGIRRQEKFGILLESIVDWVTGKEDPAFAEYFKKGPAASFDIIVMERALKNKRKIGKEEASFLLDYLVANPDTYFRAFFVSHVIPIFETQRISVSLAKKAYAEGAKSTCSILMRSALYAVRACGEDMKENQETL
ncbi:hypothetical protein NEFER03_0998 [Nematocida sp. LUAm3]|nr:hypothetical protein NEFER03_0998 [Nematocida sp. LUAm3]KAI5175398.1 hypothetical protein NEFER02_1327 [Nematocida sp. LUAm2]KAI5177645.1 hypothetical protein NEFER01_0869 [Nematocida sp. LUAm1]